MEEQRYALRKDEPDIPGPRGRLVLLTLAGGVMSAAFWVLMSLALNPELNLVHNLKGAGYAGPLTWPGRLLHLEAMTPEERTWAYILIMVVLTASYIAAIYLVRRDRRRNVTFVLGGIFVLFALLFVFAPPFQSQDVYSYAFHGRAMTVYHSNPYLLLPVARRADVFYPLIGWRDTASVYGPAFNFLAYIVTRVAGNNVVSNALGFKVLAVAFYAACLPIVYTLARRVSPGRENFALAVSAWCPILLMHICGGGHNDSIMVFFVLAGFLLYRKDHAFWGLLMLLLAVMVKMSAGLALLPYLVLYVRDKRARPLRRLASAAAAVVVVPTLLYIPFWGGTRIFKSTREVAKLYSYSSVPRLIGYYAQRFLVGIGVAGPRAESLVNPVVQVLFLGLFAVLTIYLLSMVKDFRSMILATAAISLAWFFTSLYILPWYLAVGLMAAAVSGWNALSGTYIAASAIFSLYHVPELGVTSGPWNGGHLGTNLYLSLPFLLLFAGVLAFGMHRAWLGRDRRHGEEAAPAEVRRAA